MKPDLDPYDVDAIERRHADLAQRTRVLYGQHDGEDDPTDPSPTGNVIATLVIAILLTAVAALVVVIANHPGTTP